MTRHYLSNFSQLQAHYFLFCERREYKKALKLIQNEYNQFLAAKSLLMRWCVGLFAQMGQEQKALKVLEEATMNGHFYRAAKLRHDADLQPLRLNPRFRALSAHSGTLYEEQRRQMRPEMRVLIPQTPPPWPLLLVLHENMGNAVTTEPYWTTAVEEGWVVAILQSKQLGWATGHYVWDDVESSLEQIRCQYDALCQQYPIDEQRVVVAGYGQGGYIAQKVVEHQRLLARGAILVEGWSLDEFKHLRLFLSRQPRPRYYLLAGQDVPGQIFDYYEEAQKLSRQFSRMGFLCRVEGLETKVPGLPPKLNGALSRALRFVTVSEQVHAD